MKWQHILDRKGIAGLAFFGLAATMLLLSFAHKRHVSELHDTLATIYTDRLVAEGHLYQLSRQIYEKKLLVDRYDDGLLQEQVQWNDTIQQLLESYEGTYLTPEEGLQLSKLKGHIRMSQQLEQQFMYAASPIHRDSLRPALAKHYDSALTGLHLLTRLQLQEGERLIDQSDRVVASNNIISRLAVGMLIVLGLLLMVVFSQPRITLGHTHPGHLN